MTNYTKLTDFASKDALSSGNALKVVKGAEINAEFVAIASAITSKANTASPTLTGSPKAPTPSNNDDSTNIATTAYVQNEFTGLGGTALTFTSGALNLDNTAVTAGSYGSATLVPAITVDGQGRITAASTNAIDLSSKMYTFAVADDSVATRDVYLTTGTWQILVLHIVGGYDTASEFNFDVTRAVTVNSTDVTATAKFIRTGSSGLGRWETATDLAIGSTSVTEAGTFTISIAAPANVVHTTTFRCQVTLERISD